MGLFERLHPDAGSVTHTGADTGATAAPGVDGGVALDDVRRQLHQQVIDDLGAELSAGARTEVELRSRVVAILNDALAGHDPALDGDDAAVVIAGVCDDVFGYGPINGLLADDSVTEVMCNGPSAVWVERAGRLERTGVRFVDADHLRRVIDKMVSGVGRRIDESTPLCDARLPSGARVNAVLAPVAVGGPFLTVRKFSADVLGVDQLVAVGTLSPAVAGFLRACVAGRCNIVVSGGAGSGKTTLLNVISGFIPAGERIVTVEDAKELQLDQHHVVSLESRPENVEGRGEVTIRDLVRNSLRMRPDRIVVGEVRSGEALDMLQAMNTGHTGSLATVHANSPRDALARLETLVLMAGYDLPVRAIREQLASAVDLVVQMARHPDGTRQVVRVTEVQGMEGEVVVTADLFVGDATGMRSTGTRPRFAHRLTQMGIDLPVQLFDTRPETRAR
jgi:pilus assembly protein CpaF